VLGGLTACSAICPSIILPSFEHCTLASNPDSTSSPARLEREIDSCGGAQFDSRWTRFPGNDPDWASEATIEALFDIRDHTAAQSRLRQWDLPASDELVIRRTISRGGRNRVLVNGQIISVQELQQLGGMLVSISGQHEHQRLLDSSIQLELLDASGNLEPLCAEIYTLYESFVRLSEQLQRLKRSREDRSSQMELMAFQLQELKRHASSRVKTTTWNRNSTA